MMTFKGLTLTTAPREWQDAARRLCGERVYVGFTNFKLPAEGKDKRGAVGMPVRDGFVKIILIFSGQSSREMLLTLAHEAAHFLNDEYCEMRDGKVERARHMKGYWVDERRVEQWARNQLALAERWVRVHRPYVASLGLCSDGALLDALGRLQVGERGEMFQSLN